MSFTAQNWIVIFDRSFPIIIPIVFFKPLATIFLVTLQVKINLYLSNPLGTRIQNPSGSSLSMVIGKNKNVLVYCTEM